MMNNPKKIKSKKASRKENARRLRHLPIVESTLKFFSHKAVNRLHQKGMIK